MPILFSVIAYDKKILAKYASCDGNFGEITEQVLMKAPPGNKKITYSHGHYLFHYASENNYVYFCITDKVCQRSRAFLFLNQIKRRFKMNKMKDFVNVLEEEMYRYSEDYSTITVRKGELDELNTISVRSSETILGEKILYVNNPENIAFSTITYLKETPQKILFRVKNTNVFILLIVILIILGLAIYIFGPMTCCHFIVLIIGVKYMLRRI